jgi:hypothetical protein
LGEAAPASQQRRRVRQRSQSPEIVSDDDDCIARFAASSDCGVEVCLPREVEGGIGLVQQEHRSALREHAGEVHAGTLTTGKRGHRAVEQFAQVVLGDYLGHH